MEDRQYHMIKKLLLMMIELEESSPQDWEKIFSIGDDALKYIVENELERELDPYFIKFLDDSDVRKKDSKFGGYQRRVIMNLLQHSR